MVPALVVAFLVWLAVLAFLRANRIWIIFFIVGSTGFALFLIFFGHTFLLETGLERTVAVAVHNICNVVGVPTRIFQATPESIMVMVIRQDIGWTVVQMTIECSGLLEIAVTLGIVLFFPGWPIGRRVFFAVVGAVAVYLANIVRVLIIVEVLHFAGKGSIFIAHTIIGRAVFFVIVLLVYWFTLTNPMLHDIRKRLEKEYPV